MLRKRILILCILIFSMTLIFQVKSYTMAKVENSANMSITSSEDALIAVENPLIKINKIVTENITTEILSNEEVDVDHEIITNYTITENCLIITNNTNKEVNGTISLEKNSLIRFNDKNEYDFTLSSGGFIDIVPFELVENIQDNEISDNLYIDIKITADWEGGHADIYDKVRLNVNALEPQVNLYEIDSRTPLTKILPETEEDIKDESIENAKTILEIETVNESKLEEQKEESAENELIDQLLDDKKEDAQNDINVEKKLEYNSENTKEINETNIDQPSDEI